MTGNAIGFIICRIAAIWFVISGLGAFSFGISSLLTIPDELDRFLIFAAVMTFAPFVAAFVLWHYAESISATRFGTSGISIGESVDTNDLVSIGILILGIYVLVTGIIDAFQAETFSWMQIEAIQEREAFAQEISAQRTADRVAYLLSILIGFALVALGKARLR